MLTEVGAIKEFTSQESLLWLQIKVKKRKICLEKGDHAGFRLLVETILQATFWNDHVFSVKTAKNWNRFNVDWVPTLCLGHSKKEAGPKNLE